MNRRERRLQAKQDKKAGRQRAPQPAGQQSGRQTPFAEAIQLVGADELARAETLCKQVRHLYPNDPDGLLVMAMIASKKGQADDAVKLTGEAVALAPKYADAHFNHGSALADTGKLAEAVKAYGVAGNLDPGFADAHLRRGKVLVQMGDDPTAQAAFESAIRAQGNLADAWFELGNVLGRLDRVDEAAEALRQSILANPDFAPAYYNLGCMLERKGYTDHPRDVFEEAVRLNPRFVDAHHALAGTWLRSNDYDKAIAGYRKAIGIDPEFARSHAGLAGALREMGYIDEARASFADALALEPDNAGWRVRAALALPVIPQSVEEINTARQQYSENVQALCDDAIKLTDPYVEVGTTNFFLSYHELDDRPLQEAVAAMYLDACPSLGWVAPHCQQPPKPKTRLRLGICSTYMRGHTLGKLTLGTIKTLSRERFEVVLLRFPGCEDDMAKAIDDTADTVVAVPSDLARARQIIADETLDILFYPDIGMEPLTYFLAFSRLAPVQYTSWGHPDTTGIPNLDYFLSSQGLEPDGAETCYSEKLVKLRDLTTYYYPPEPLTSTFVRADYGLPEKGHLYVCPQTLFKFHPDFDQVLANLLRRDPNGTLVLIDDVFGGYWRKLLLKRVTATFPDVAGRVVFVEKMPLDKFFGLVTLADAVLDVPTFSGGNSSIEAFSCGAPIVTWPGGYLRGRITLCCYRQMGIDDLVVDNGDDFVAKALRLADDRDFRDRMRAKILANVPKLYENTAMVRELEDFLHAAHQAMCDGQGRRQWP